MIPETVTRLVQEIVLEGKVPAKEVARRIGKPYPTLMRELNPFDTGAKLGAETLLEILKVTGDHSVLQYMAERAGQGAEPRGEKRAAARRPAQQARPESRHQATA